MSNGIYFINKKISIIIKSKKASKSLLNQLKITVEGHKKNRGYFLRFAPQMKLPKIYFLKVSFEIKLGYYNLVMLQFFFKQQIN